SGGSLDAPDPRSRRRGPHAAAPHSVRDRGEAGGLTIAQDADTSVICGMPRAACLIDAAERELPLRQIGPTRASLAERDAEANV
ncbi:MAG TPA: chemotaxis protein CheB, partial [Myxococcota bacterium]|nr:chemotaxis protein CheB [Myxococcota bacterium]